MNGYKYEAYCATWLKKHGYHNIQVTQASKDQGIDIIATKNAKRYGFQCKYYESTVGNEAVQQAFTGSAFYNCDVACVITNNTFTKSAIQLAQETDVILIDSIDPEKKSLFLEISHWISILLFLTGICLLGIESSHSQYNDLSIIGSMFLIISSITGHFISQSSICLCIASITSFLSFILSFQYHFLNGPISLILKIVILIYHIFLDIQWILYKKNENHIYQQNVHSEILDDLYHSTNQKGIQLASIISQEIHHPITFIDFEIDEDTMKYKFRSTIDLSNDFALLEYSFNQYSSYNDSNEIYTFQKITPKTFYVIINNSHRISK